MIFPSGDDINFEAPSWRLGEGSRLVVGVRLLFLDGRVLDSTGSSKIHGFFEGPAIFNLRRRKMEEPSFDLAGWKKDKSLLY